jgi:hypothetical protein
MATAGTVRQGTITVMAGLVPAIHALLCFGMGGWTYIKTNRRNGL